MSRLEEEMRETGGSTGLHSLPPHIDELPSLDEVLRQANSHRVSLDDSELFALQDRIIRLDDESILIFRHEDLRRLGPNPNLGNVPAEIFVQQFLDGPSADHLDPRQRESIWRFQRNAVFTTTKPVHEITKPILSKPLIPGAMPPFRAIAESMSQELVGRVVDAGEIDFLEDFAQPFVFAFWAEVLGMSEGEALQLRGIMAGMAANSSLQHRTPEGLVAYAQALGEYLELLTGIIERTRLEGHNAFLNWRAQQFKDIKATPEGFPESQDIALAVDLFDGFYAVGIAISNCLFALLAHPQSYERVRHDPGLLPNAVSEGLRLYAPVRLIARYASVAMHYDEMLIPAHTKVVMYWGGGNRDPSVFEEPGQFDLTRNHARSTTFGAGAQICPGRNLTRTLVAACLSALVRADLSIRIVSHGDWTLDTPVTNELRLENLVVSVER